MPPQIFRQPQPQHRVVKNCLKLPHGRAYQSFVRLNRKRHWQLLAAPIKSSVELTKTPSRMHDFTFDKSPPQANFNCDNKEIADSRAAL